MIMKKVLALSILASVILISHTEAQTRNKATSRGNHIQINPDEAEGNMVQKVELVFKTVKVTEGANAVPVAKLQGTLSFVKKGENYSGVVFTDSTGKSRSLSVVENTCSYATTDKQITVHFCETARTLSGTGSRQTTITIAL